MSEKVDVEAIQAELDEVFDNTTVVATRKRLACAWCGRYGPALLARIAELEEENQYAADLLAISQREVRADREALLKNALDNGALCCCGIGVHRNAFVCRCGFICAVFEEPVEDDDAL
jgi:hypothetical protein